MWRCVCALLVFTSQINEKWLNNCYLFLLGLFVKRKGYVLDKPSNSTQSYLGLSVKRKGCVFDKPSNSTQSYLVCLSNERAACSISQATPPNLIWFCLSNERTTCSISQATPPNLIWICHYPCLPLSMFSHIYSTIMQHPAPYILALKQYHKGIIGG